MSLLNNVVRTGKMIVKANINAAKQMWHFYEKEGGLFVEPEELGSTGFQDLDIKLAKFDFLFAAQGQMDIPAAVCMGNPSLGFIMIFVNSAWQNSNKETKYAILAHELGHVQCGHLNSPIKGWINNFGRMFGSKASVNNELDADLVALDNGHYKGLKQALMMFRDYSVLNSHPMTEINARLNQVRCWEQSGRSGKPESQSIIGKIKSIFNK